MHKGSSADKEGLKRGMEITEIDNQRITTTNVQACYSKLIKPSSPTSIKVKEQRWKSIYNKFRTYLCEPDNSPPSKRKDRLSGVFSF